MIAAERLRGRHEALAGNIRAAGERLRGRSLPVEGRLTRMVGITLEARG